MDGRRTVVCKLGTSTLVDATGAPDKVFIEGLMGQVARLAHEGYGVVVVSSGAVAAGLERLGFSERPHDMPTLQACAAAGQASLTEAYAEVLARRGVPCGQVLITRRDLVDREGYLNVRNTLQRLVELGAVPVVNENDTVSVAEFAFGDNDTLGAIVASLVGAQLYVILSDVDGLYTANPQTHPEARLLSEVHGVTPEVAAMAGGAGTAWGTGGMATKVRAARASLAAGIPMVVCRGRRENVLVDAAHGEDVGTRFVPLEGQGHEAGRKLWIGLAERPHGSLVLDAGACRAVQEQGASVLPVGVTEVRGTFSAGDVVDVVSQDGIVVGRGLARYSSEEMVRVRGLRLDVIARFMPERAGQPAVHRDELLVF